jgi:hypothetical protein
MLCMKTLWMTALVATMAFGAINAVAATYYSKTDVFDTAANFSHVTNDGTRYDDRAGGFRLQDAPSGGYVADGSFTSEDLHYSSFNRAVPSWNADCPQGTYVTIDLQTSPDAGTTWSSWYRVAAWGDPAITNKFTASDMIRKDGMGYVNEDTLELSKVANRLRYRISLHTQRPEVSPLVSLVAIAIADSTKPVAADNTPGPAWGKEVPAPWRTQTIENADIAYRICGPTSTSVTLASHGVVLPTAFVAQTAWDNLNGIYGNWPFLAAAASKLMRDNSDALPPVPGKKKTYRAYVLWCPDWKAVEAEILKGNPCIISIRFGKNELHGAPISSTDGHIIVARGFTKDGDVICNDSAARTEDAGRVVYNRQELMNARHANPVIVVEPYG